MTQEDKQLLLQDLSARLPYGVKINLNGGNDAWTLKGIFEGDHTGIMLILGPSFSYENITPATSNWSLSLCKPYLRPMSSMTEEEKKEYNIFFEEYAPDDRWPYLTKNFVEEELVSELIDWLNKKMFDFRGLIPKGHAIEVTDDNNPYKD